MPHRFGFVMEQTLGNATHYTNMRAVVDEDPRVDASWYPLTFPPRGALETVPPIRGNWSLRASLRARRILARAGAADRHDALFFHTQVTTLFSVAVMRRAPSVISLDATPRNYDSLGAAYGHRESGEAVEGLKAALNRRALHAARAFVTFSDWARRSLIDDYGVDGERITVIPPGVNLALWPRPTPRGHTGPVRVLFVGGDFARKGGNLLLQAFRAGLHEQCELHLVTRESVPPAPNIHVYQGVAPNSDLLRRLYADADIFALPTLADCYSHASIEAMACGLPVITCPVGGIPEIVRDGETGLLVPPGDGAALAAALKELVGDPARRVSMGLRGRSIVERDYDSAVNARRILAIMMRISGRPEGQDRGPGSLSETATPTVTGT